MKILKSILFGVMAMATLGGFTSCQDDVDAPEVQVPVATKKANTTIFDFKKEYWEDALADYPDQTDKITEFLSSRLQPGYEERDLRRATDALLRRGHSYQQIRRALDALCLAEDFQEDF